MYADIQNKHIQNIYKEPEAGQKKTENLSECAKSRRKPINKY